MGIFISLSVLLASVCLFFSYLFSRLAAGCRSRLAEGLPRAKVPGLLLGIVCLVWSAWHGCLMLEGPLEKYHPVVWLLVPTTAVLSWFYLDYLFSRALGGFFALAANELIRQGFTHAVTLRPLFSVICLLLGVCGLFLIGTPWRLRDLLEIAGKKPRAGRLLSLALLLCAVVLIVLPLL